MEFELEWSAFWARMGPARKLVLATGAEGRITARTMSCICHGEAIYFQTDSKMLKARQLGRNPRAALCGDNIQIEGEARPLGHPLLEENRFFAQLFHLHYPRSFETYTALEDEVLYRVTPLLVSLWEYDDGKPFRRIFDPAVPSVCLEAYNG